MNIELEDVEHESIIKAEISELTLVYSQAKQPGTSTICEGATPPHTPSAPSIQKELPS